MLIIGGFTLKNVSQIFTIHFHSLHTLVFIITQVQSHI